MNWLYSYIAAFLCIFAIPFYNNAEGLKIIAQDIQTAIVSEISDWELMKKISEYGSTPNEYTAIKDNRYKESTKPATMLQLATEVYVGNLQEITYYNMGVKERDVKGWTCITKYPKDVSGKNTTKSGASFSLWQNNYEKNTFTVSAAGTDQLKDIMQYGPMETSATHSEHQKELANFLKTIQKYTTSPIEKLYITGHSLGGFLAMSAGTDLIDAEIAKNNGQTSNSLCTYSDINSKLKKENLFVYTFSAPGLFTKIPDDIPQIVKNFLDISDNIPAWSKEKTKNHKNKVYDKNVFQYVNTLDLVTNFKNLSNITLLPKAIKNLANTLANNCNHVGTVYSATIKLSFQEKMNIIKRFNIFKGDNIATTALNTAACIANLHYHLPSTYNIAFLNNTFKKI